MLPWVLVIRPRADTHTAEPFGWNRRGGSPIHSETVKLSNEADRGRIPVRSPRLLYRGRRAEPNTFLWRPQSCSSITRIGAASRGTRCLRSKPLHPQQHQRRMSRRSRYPMRPKRKGHSLSMHRPPARLSRSAAPHHDPLPRMRRRSCISRRCCSAKRIFSGQRQPLPASSRRHWSSIA